MAKLTVKELEMKDKRVFVRVDYNVPLEEKDGQMVITDDTRVRATLDTLDLLARKGARIVLASHLGRPKGKPDQTMSLRPVAAHLANLLGRPVAFADDCVGDKATKTADALKPGDLLLLENLRFHEGEEKNDAAFAEKLAGLADLYVDDAFGAAHRAHASTHMVPALVAKRGGSCAAGLLMEKELKFLGEELDQPRRPFIVILGGAKVSDKINVINRLLEKADMILIGGAMSYTFKLARGFKTGKSLVEPDRVDVARQALEKAKARGVQFLLPTDHVVATPVLTEKKDKKGRLMVEFQNPRVHTDPNIPDSEEGVDIGPETITRYRQEILKAKTILWNGPMGIFEKPKFAAGTNAVAQAVAEATRQGATSIIGGGDSIKALNQAGLGNQVTFMSTGGGASLEFLEGQTLPGVAALSDR
jgi:phosphoglycerate kinase